MRVDVLPLTVLGDRGPGAGPLGAMALRLRTFGLVLRAVWPAGGKGQRLVDLGAGHGLFSTMARTHGFRVTALDARARWTPAQAVGAQDAGPAPQGPAVDWQEADIRRADLSGHDVILAIGVTYHLPLAAQMDLLHRTAGRPIVIDTEVYDPADPAAAVQDRLRPIMQDGFVGALCRETGNLWSAADMQDSFWPTHETMLSMFRAAGRASVALVEPPYRSRFGWRRWYIADLPE